MRTRSLTALAAAFSLFTASLVYAQAEFDKVQHFKAPPPGQKKGQTEDGGLVFDSAKKEMRFMKKGSPDFTIKYEAIKSMLYEKTAKPRYTAGLLVAWPLLFTKSKKHYFTVQYNDEAANGQYALFRLDKENFRDVLAKAEADTGKKVERSEEH